LAKWVYDFSEGSREMRELLGGKGANVAEMTRVLGPALVPAGFTITTEACVEYMRLGTTDPEGLAIYGLIPTQQPADIYDGWGHGGRGGWSWYTGSAARMVSAAYALLGIGQQNGRVVLGDDLFEPKGELRVLSLRIGETTWTPEGKR